MNKTFPTLFVVLLLLSGSVFSQNIGLAKSAEQFGREVVYTLNIESFSDDTLRFVQVIDDLDITFGAGNYSVSSSPSVTGKLCANPSFDGSNDKELLLNNSGCFLPIRGVAQISFQVSINSVTDVGNGLGVYANSATGVGRLLTPTSDVDDISNWGTNPDPDGNDDPTDSGEDDPTLIDLTQNPIIGLAKSASLNGNEVTFRFYLENFGNRGLEKVSITDDLDATFGAGNYVINSGPSFFDDPGTLTLNSGFDGSADNALTSSGTLAISETAGIEITVEITNVADLGNGLGVYENQAKATAQSSTRKQVEDLSDDGTDPDPNGNGNPREGGENDPTKITIGQEPIIGVAKNVTVSADSVIIDLFLENLGNTVLSNISLTENLKNVFGAGNFNIRSTRILDASSGLVLNPSFDGNFNFEILGVSSLSIGALDTIQIIIENIILSDQGLGYGVYENQVFASATSPGGATTNDYSDDGTNADPNGNGNPTEPGENDKTSFSITPNPKIGIALEYRPGVFPIVEQIYHIENLGNETLSEITVENNLNIVYGSGNYTNTQFPVFKGGSPTFVYNTSFNGNSNTSLLKTGSSLAPGEKSSFGIKQNISTITDQGYGSGIYQNQVTVNSNSPNSTVVSDVSHKGKNPDPNNDGDPIENDITIIDLNAIPSIGIALDANVSGNTVTFDVYLENLGNVDYSELSVSANLDQVFGAGNYFLSSPTFIDNPGTVTLNPLYNGTSDNSDILLPQSSTFVASETAQIRIVVTVDSVQNTGFLGLGQYSSQFTVSGLNTFDVTNSDLSDFGTDPDPNGNDKANDSGENDKTNFTIDIGGATGIAQNITTSGNDITFDLYIENFASGAMNNLSIIHDLDGVFGQNNYEILSPPTFIVDPGTITLNGAFDGSANTDLLSSGSTLALGATGQIQFKIRITHESESNVYYSQPKIIGLSPNGFVVTDLSDDGTEPDFDNNGDPTNSGENDISSVFKGSIGHSFYATVDGTLITYHVTLENLGKVQISSMTLAHQLISVFGFGNYSKASGPFTDNSSAITLNSSFDGLFSPSLITSGTLKPGEKAQIIYTINVTNVTNQGSGFGVYPYQSTVSGTDVNGNALTDLSDLGFIPDSNGNGFAGDAGEDDKTIVTLDDETNVGVALTASVSGKEVTFDYYFENLGNTLLNDLELSNNLDDVFGAGNYSISQAPTFIDDPGTITLNSSFDGSGAQALISAGGTLDIGDTGQIRVVVDVLNIVNKGIGVGNYSNQVLISGSGGATAYDLSDKGIDPDSNDNSIPFDLAENDPTDFKVNFSSVGIAQNASVDNCSGVISFTYYLKNLGASPLDSISLEHDLDGLFGSEMYEIVQAPSLSSEIRGLVLNGSYDGSSITNILLPSSTMESVGAGSEIITMKVKLLSPTQTTYKSGAKVTATDDSNGQFSDLSDSGTNPDPNNNFLADEVGENDSTLINTFAPLRVSVSSTNISCNGGSNGAIDLSVSGGKTNYLYKWSNNSLLEDLTGLSAGTYTLTVTDANSCIATASLTLSEPAVLTASISASSNATCNGSSNGSATVGVTGGTTNYSYSWSPSGGSLATASNLAAGSYTVNITDANSCTATSTVTITQPDVLAASISSQTNVSCNGLSDGAATVSVTGGTTNYSYSWSPSGGSLATAGNLAAGSYTVNITDANSCTATSTVTITQPDVLAASISSQTNVSCNGLSDGAATVSVTGGTTNHSYSWSPSGGSLATASNLAAGSYTVNITDANSCTATSTVTITQPDVLAASISSQTNVSCNGLSDGAATVSVTGGTTNYSYSWSPLGGNLATGSGLAAGGYTVTVTDANSCTATASVTITQPAVLTASVSSSTNVACNGLSDGTATVSASGGTTNYSYSWSPSGGNLATGSGLAAGGYTVTVTDANSCTATASVTITQPAVLTASVSSSTNVACNGLSDGTATVSASGGTTNYSYSWSPLGGNLATGSGLAAGGYTVTVTDANGCTATASVTITQPAVLVASINSSTNVTCNGLSDGTATVSASGGTTNYSYSWSPSGGNLAIGSGLAAGGYTVTVTDANGCTATASVTITQPAVLTASVNSSTNVTCNGLSDGTATVSASGGTTNYSYSWSPSGGNLAIGSGLAAGGYTVTVTDANGCTATASVTITQPALPTLSISSSSAPTACEVRDGSIVFNTLNVANGSYLISYLFNGAVTSKQVSLTSNSFSVTNLASGNYQSFSFSFGSCPVTLEQSISLLGAAFETSASNTGPYQKGDEIQLMTASGVEFSWTGPNGFYSNIQAPNIDPAKEENAGHYVAIVKGANNCIDTVSTDVVVNCLPASISYYVTYAGPGTTPEVISLLTENLKVQINPNRPVTVLAYPNCAQNDIESMKLSLSGTSELQYHEDNEPIYALHDGNGYIGADYLSENYYTFIGTAYDQDNIMGNEIIGPDVIRFYMVSGTRTISKPALSKDRFCNGDSFVVNVNSVGTFALGNLFKVYLSDKDGNFLEPRQIGFSSNPNLINCKLPYDLLSGTNYKIKVSSSDPVVTSLISSYSLNIIGKDLNLISSKDDISGTTTKNYAAESIKASNNIKNSGKTEFNAGKNIQLEPGFIVESGSVFSTKIENQCTN